jgi:predicted lipid-binding transport protein (Tim44 family)
MAPVHGLTGRHPLPVVSSAAHAQRQEPTVFSGLTGWHLIILLLSLAPFVLWIIALVQIAMSKAAGGTIALWIVIVTLFPLIGAIVWFAVGRRTATQNIPAVLAREAPPAAARQTAPRAETYAAPESAAEESATLGSARLQAATPEPAQGSAAQEPAQESATLRSAPESVQGSAAQESAQASGADVPPPSAPAGWYPSPSHPGLRQWWDGAQWTSHLETGPPTP